MSRLELEVLYERFDRFHLRYFDKDILEGYYYRRKPKLEPKFPEKLVREIEKINAKLQHVKLDIHFALLLAYGDVIRCNIRKLPIRKPVRFYSNEDIDFP